MPPLDPARLVPFTTAMRELGLAQHRDYELTFSHNRWNFTYLRSDAAHHSQALALLETLLNNRPAAAT